MMEYLGVISGNVWNLVVKMGLVLTLAVAAGCASTGAGGMLPEEAVRLRAQAWADELLAHDFEGAWALTSPGYRQFSTAKDYKATVLGSARWTSAVVKTVSCAEDVCAVGVEVEYTIPRLHMSNKRLLDYKWLQDANDWWLYVPAK